MSFADYVSDWAKKTEARVDAVYGRSIELLAEDMAKTVHNGGRLPHLTGNLMRSQLASPSVIQMSPTNAPHSGSDVGAVTASVRFGDTVYIGFQADYAHRLNYGFAGQDKLGRTYNQEGRHFLEAAIANWPKFVRQASAEVEASVNARKAGA